jgi:hypothetical protein
MSHNDNTITPADVRGRALVIGTAPHDADAAAKLATKIVHPWYRCQALAISAEFATGPKRRRLIEAAFAAAFEQEEPNRIVSVAFWPLRVLVADRADGVAARVGKLIEVAEREPHNLRRAHALQRLVIAVESNRDCLDLVVPPLAAALLCGHGRRIDRIIRETFEQVRLARPDLAFEVAMQHKAGAKRDGMLGVLGMGGQATTRSEH